MNRYKIKLAKASKVLDRIKKKNIPQHSKHSKDPKAPIDSIDSIGSINPIFPIDPEDPEDEITNIQNIPYSQIHESFINIFLQVTPFMKDLIDIIYRYQRQARMMVSCDMEKIIIRNVNSEFETVILKEISTRVTLLTAIHESSNLFATGSVDKIIRLWDIHSADSKCLKGFKGHRIYPTCIASIVSLPHLIVSGDFGGRLFFWNIQTGKPHFELSFKGSGAIISVFSVIENRGLIVIASQNNIITYNLLSNKTVSCWKVHSETDLATLVSPDVIATVPSREEKLCLWNIHSGECLKVIDAPWIRCLCTLPSYPDLIVTGNKLAEICLWNIPTGKCDKTMKLRNYGLDLEASTYMSCLTSIVGFPELILCGGDEGEMIILNIHSGECIKMLKGHTSSIGAICFFE